MFHYPAWSIMRRGAEDDEQVLELAPRAAAEAAKTGAHREAATYLATALSHAGSASIEVRAQLAEDWAYEAGLALEVDDTIIKAAQTAVALWRELGRKNKLARSLLRLSRLHWYRGEGALSQRFADEAVEALAGEPPSSELAFAYAVRSQLHMFNDRFAPAIEWSRKAIAIAEEIGDIETRVHALNNLGNSLLYSGDESGKAHFEECLALAQQHGLHEQVDRAYSNYGEYVVLAKDFALAERILSEGIAFTTRHDLDAGVHNHMGRLAQLRLDQGRLEEAETIAAGVVKLDRLSLATKLPALTVLAKARLRLGKADGPSLIRQSMERALKTEEQQHIVVARAGMIEMAWLLDDVALGHSELAAMTHLNVAELPPWDMGDFAVWWKRLAMPDAFPWATARKSLPRQLEFGGNPAAAAAEWTRLGLPYEAACSEVVAEDGMSRAMKGFAALGASAAVAMVRRKAKASGFIVKPAKEKRGPYAAARRHSLGLTHRESEVIELLVQGLGNREIANRLQLSSRTVEHHVSAALGKFNATNRMDLMLRLRNEPWLASGEARI